MDRLHEKGLLFGVSITVTTQNVNEVVSAEFMDTLASRGCKLVVFVEFVPVTEESQELVPGEDERTILKEGIDRLRQDYEETVFVSFPGDEKSSGGCIAAGRGFSISVPTAVRNPAHSRPIRISMCAIPLCVRH